MQILARLNKILNFWTERGVFDAAAVESMRAAMKNTPDPAIALAQRLAQVCVQACSFVT